MTQKPLWVEAIWIFPEENNILLTFSARFEWQTFEILRNKVELREMLIINLISNEWTNQQKRFEDQICFYISGSIK